jgi:hypothetical protein
MLRNEAHPAAVGTRLQQVRTEARPGYWRDSQALLRAQIPTGDVSADLGIRAELQTLNLWAGGARRFSKQS